MSDRPSFLVAFYATDEQRWRAFDILLVLPGEDPAGKDPESVELPVAGDLNHTAQERDVWASIDHASANVAEHWTCVHRAQGSFVWRTVEPEASADSFEDEPRIA